MKPTVLLYFGGGSVFSHWYPGKFNIEGIEYCCAEQYIMHRKAILFNDHAIAEKVLRSSDPKRHRYLGRKVNGFIKAEWQKQCKQYAIEANFAKFSQNNHLQDLLLKTAGMILGEASPYDRVWGIGLSTQNSKAHDPEQWRGKNLAGEALETVRKIFLNTVSK